MGRHPRRSPLPRRFRHALPSCLCSGSSTSATKASVNSPSNQQHHPSCDNPACAGLYISTACHPSSLNEESKTSTQTSMAGKRPRGRHKTIWADPIKHDLLNSAGLDTTNSAQMVFDRPQWKAFVSGLPTLEPEQGS